MSVRIVRNCRPQALRNFRSFCSRDHIQIDRKLHPSRHYHGQSNWHGYGYPNGHGKNWMHEAMFKKGWMQEAANDLEKFIGHFSKQSGKDFSKQFGHDFSKQFECGFSRHEGIQVTHNKSVFEVKLELPEFKPQDLKVKLTDFRLLVSGKHDQKTDHHGLVAREFHREFEVPKDVNLESMKSDISEDGVLTIRAMVKGEENQGIKIEREYSS